MSTKLLEKKNERLTSKKKSLKKDGYFSFSESNSAQNKELLESTQKLLKMGSWEWDLKTDTVLWSNNLYDIFEISHLIHPLLPKDYLERIHSADFQKVQESVLKCINEGICYNLEHRIITPNGTEKVISAVGEAVRDQFGEITKLVGTAQDISEKSKLEKERIYNEALLKAMFDESPDALFLTTIAPKNILHVNKKAAELFEMEDEKEFIGKFGPHFHKIPWKKDDFDNLNKALDESNFWTSEIEYITQKKNTFWGSISIKRLKIKDEWFELVRVADITRRKSLEFQLIQAQKMESIGTIAGGIAHDFNNLLAMIMGTAELIKMHSEQNPKVFKFADRILEASDKGASIAKQLLLFSRPELIELKPISLSHIVVQVQQMISHFLPKSITIETETFLSNGIINGDGSHLYQVLLNLSLNAADAMPNGGKLIFKQRNVRQKHLVDLFPDATKPEYVALSVSDTGTGIPKDIINRIFDPFFTTKEKGKGTGLGLSIVHGIIKSHHGFISVNSEDSKGTTFTIYLPTVNSESTPAEEKNTNSPSNEPVKVKLNILVVDDEKVIRESLVEYLRLLGHHVFISDDGINALYLFKKKQADIDLIITDLGMPRMGGEEFVEKVFEINRKMKVIIASGYLDKSPKNDLLKKGVFDVISKPYKFNELKRMISKVKELKTNNLF